MSGEPQGLANTDLLIVGGGACGVIAALAAAEAGCEVFVFERDALPRGSTSLSSGLIPAAGTRAQRRQGIHGDSAQRLFDDIQGKAKGSADPILSERFAACSAQVIDWLEREHQIPFEVLDGFLYPGHSVARMHAVPERTGEALLERLWHAAQQRGVHLIASAQVNELLFDAPQRIQGLRYSRPNGQSETVTARAVVLACNGFGGNRTLVRELIAPMSDALYFGHSGNQGEAILWARQFGFELADTGAYQGHGSVAHPHGVLITWGVIMDGGIQVNRAGKRFWNEAQGYSEAALAVLAQDGAVAWNIYDERVHRRAQQFPDYQKAEALGAIRRAETAAELASRLGVATESLSATLQVHEKHCIEGSTDSFGRQFEDRLRLRAPYYAVQVTGALFHTQGGITVDSSMRVRRLAGSVVANLFAAGGAARGVSGHSVWGYLSGNGLLSAVAGGWIAGQAAAQIAGRQYSQAAADRVR